MVYVLLIQDKGTSRGLYTQFMLCCVLLILPISFRVTSLVTWSMMRYIPRTMHPVEPLCWFVMVWCRSILPIFFRVISQLTWYMMEHILRTMHPVYNVLLCFVLAMSNLQSKIAPVPVMQPWRISVNRWCQLRKSFHTTKTKLAMYNYTVYIFYMIYNTSTCNQQTHRSWINQNSFWLAQKDYTVDVFCKIQVCMSKIIA